MSIVTNTIVRFLRAKEGFVSGTAMSRELGLSRNAVWKHVGKLRRQGYRIESATHHGYRLIGVPDRPTTPVVQGMLSTLHLGRILNFAEQTESTNADATHLANMGTAHGTVVVADTQNSGRGRLGREWHSPPGRNLYASMVLRPAVPPARVPQLAIVAAIALLRCLRALAPELGVKVKWPNDVFVGRRKLAGILCELEAEVDRVHHTVVGIGVNVNLPATDIPADLGATATSLLIETGGRYSRAEVLAALLNAFEPAYLEWLRDGLAPFVEEWQAASILNQRLISVRQFDRTLQGTCVGMALDGALLLQQADGQVLHLHAGDVHVDAY